jgi:hypothetical protein
MPIVALTMLPIVAAVLPRPYSTVSRPPLRVAPQPTCATGATLVEALEQTLPFLDDEDLLAEDVSYSGLGVSLSGRAACLGAAESWRSTLPARLTNLDVRAMTVLPPDEYACQDQSSG